MQLAVSCVNTKLSTIFPFPGLCRPLYHQLAEIHLSITQLGLRSGVSDAAIPAGGDGGHLVLLLSRWTMAFIWDEHR